MATLVVDNGAGILKAGLLPANLDAAAAELAASPVRLANATAKSRLEKKFFVVCANSLPCRATRASCRDITPNTPVSSQWFVPGIHMHLPHACTCVLTSVCTQADGLDTAVELSALYIRRPHDRGYVVNWDLLGDVWQRMCHADVLGVKPGETSVLVTEPLFCPNEIKDNMDEFIFEEMGFQRFCCAPAPLLAYADYKCWDPDSVLSRTGCGILVDSGFSFTHTVPIYEGRIVHKACRRIDLGGKALTNLLKETISHRQFNMMDETVLINSIKERLCFVSTRFDHDLRVCKKRGGNNPIRRLYSLPTGLPGTDRLGHVVSMDGDTETSAGKAAASPSKRAKAGTSASDSPSKARDADADVAAGKGAEEAEEEIEEVLLEVGNERFTVPEVLFAPNMVGMHQCGIAHAIEASIGLLDPDLHSLLYSTVVANGGNTVMPGFHQRLEAELRMLAPDTFDVSVPVGPQASDEAAWRGGMRLAASNALDRCWITKAEYEEKGHHLCRQRFKEVQNSMRVRKPGAK